MVGDPELERFRAIACISQLGFQGLHTALGFTEIRIERLEPIPTSTAFLLFSR